MSKKKIELNKEELYNLYIEQNLTVKQIAQDLDCSTITINRLLKQFNIIKSNELRRQAISKTKQGKSEAEKAEYSKKLSQSKLGTGLGKTPWNKGKTGIYHNPNKGKKMSAAFCEAVKAGLANMTPEAKLEQRTKQLVYLKQKTPWNKGVKTGSLPTNTLIKAKQREFATKKLNNSFNTSAPEERAYLLLLKYFNEDDVIRQYHDSRYPFNCDFYIKSLDLFIEINASWTHNTHAFDINNSSDLQILQQWQIKAQTSEYYKNAIDTWTKRDPLKLETATYNKLNYLVFYTETDLTIFLNTLLEDNYEALV